MDPAMLALAALATLAAQDAGAPPVSWTRTSPLAIARHSGCSVRLTDGRVFVAGGTGADGSALASAEIYLPEGSFIPASPMAAPRSRHACTLLADGRVLVSGGDPDGTVEVYDPAADSWQTAEGTGQARFGATATLLADGRVLIAGGTSPDGATLSSLETFRPLENRLVPLDAKLTSARSRFAAVLLANQTVMFIGGANDNLPALDSTDIFNPTDGSVVAGPGLYVARASHSATLLNDGRVLVAGGSNGEQDLDSAEVYTPVNIGFSRLEARLVTARREHSAILIPGNGGVLLAGGMAKDAALAATELFQPVEGTFAALGDLTLPRSGMMIAAVGDGQILAAGGMNAEGGAQSACGVLFAPFIQFDKALYRPLDSVRLSGGNFKGGTKITFTLDLVSGGIVTLANNRLATASVTTPPGTVSQLFTGFSAVPILSTTTTDAGRTVLLIAQYAGGTLQVTAPVRVLTSMQLTLPNGIYSGLDTSFSASVSRNTGAFPLTGTLTLSAVPTTGSCVSDGSVNTIQFTEAGSNTVSSSLNTLSVVASLSKAMPAIPMTKFNVTASYSGDAANDPSSATACFQAVSRATSVVNSGLPTNAQAGIPFPLTASVTAQPGTPQFGLTGTVTFTVDGFPLGTQQISSQQSNPPRMTASRQFTPLILGPVNFQAQYGGDPFFSSSSSVSSNVTVVKATPTVTAINAPATYSCDVPYTFGVQVTFPPAIGINGGLQAGTAVIRNGTQFTLLGTTSTPLTTISPGLATGTVTTLVLDVLSSPNGFVATFPGDTLLNAVTSAAINPVLQRAATSLSLQVTANPLQAVIRISTPLCSRNFTGLVEIADPVTNTPYLVVSVPAIVRFGEPASILFSAALPPLPPGARSFIARYRGDFNYLASTSEIVTLTVQ